MKTLFIVVLSGLLIIACKSKKADDPEPVFEEGILIYYSNPGCGWHVRLDNADENGMRFLEPTNLDAFTITLGDSVSVLVKYKERDNLYSVCQSGKIVDL